MRLHFKPLSIQMEHPPPTMSKDSDFDTDTISIAVSNITTSNSLQRAMRNLIELFQQIALVL